MKKNQSQRNVKKFELTQEQINELAEAFELFDRDGDQMIAAKELHVVLMAIGRQMSVDDVSQSMKELKEQNGSYIDPNEEPELNFQEFIALMTKEMLENMMDEELIEAFKTFNCEDENDSITRVALGEVMAQYGEKLSEQDLAALFKELDKDGDNRVSFNDFLRTMMSK